MKFLFVRWMVALGWVLVTASVVAEDSPPSTEKKFRVGPMLGLHSTTLLCDSCRALGIEGRLRFAAGGQVEMLIGKHFAVELEALYVEKGAKVVSSSSADLLISYNTLEIPLHFKGRWGNEKVHGVAFGGPQIGFAISRTVESAGGGSLADLPSKGIDFGIHFGGGVEFLVAPDTFLYATGRVNIGLTNLDVGVIAQSTTTFGVLGLTGIKFAL